MVNVRGHYRNPTFVHFMDWKKNIGRIIAFTTSDGEKYNGVLYSVTEDIWKPKRTPETTLNFWNEYMSAHIRASEVKKYTLGKKYNQDVTSRAWLDNPH